MITQIEKTHLVPYLNLFDQFIANKIDVGIFETEFLNTRRYDEYYMSSSFSKQVENILNDVFHGVDWYAPPELYVSGEDISEEELRIIVSKAITDITTLL